MGASNMKALKAIGVTALVLSLAGFTAECGDRNGNNSISYAVICVDDTVMKRVKEDRCEPAGSRFRWFWIDQGRWSVPDYNDTVDRTHGTFTRPNTATGNVGHVGD
jgi:hypothetical protein